MTNAVELSNVLVQNLNGGDLAGCAYDTAWVASLVNQNGEPHFPRAKEWILKNQKEDGSWGSQIEYLHDRVISTAAAIMCLDGKDENKKTITNNGDKVGQTGQEADDKTDAHRDFSYGDHIG